MRSAPVPARPHCRRATAGAAAPQARRRTAAARERPADRSRAATAIRGIAGFAAGRARRPRSGIRRVRQRRSESASRSSYVTVIALRTTAARRGAFGPAQCCKPPRAKPKSPPCHWCNLIGSRSSPRDCQARPPFRRAWWAVRSRVRRGRTIPRPRSRAERRATRLKPGHQPPSSDARDMRHEPCARRADALYSPTAMMQSPAPTQRWNGQPIVLVGLMGVGKSTVGRRLAARLGLPFVDADCRDRDRRGNVRSRISSRASASPISATASGA